MSLRFEGRVSAHSPPACLRLPQETLRTLDPELLEEFLRAAEGMEAFCTLPQLRDMEFFTKSVRTQWEVSHKLVCVRSFEWY